ncbi:MAG TPA: zf-HC2 domain-containing protein [Polyangiaceae bacterium]|nr:zf-HC2 domain-containing protein [Polyangiaceae bacterium]
MNDKRCPSEDELLAFADADLPPEQLRRIEQHLELCSSCAKHVMALHALIADVAAPVPGAPLDVSEHLAGVMRRLDAPLESQRRLRWLPWGGAFVAAAAVALAVGLSGTEGPSPDQLTPRGGPAMASLSRDVGLQLYAQEQRLRPLEVGDRIRPSTALTAGLRNLGGERAHLLLFAVDARHVVHWIAPEFSAVGSDPEAASVAPSTTEHLLPTAAAFEDLALGPLRVVAVISKHPTRVSQVESLTEAELDAEGLMKRFPRAEIRQYSLVVVPAAAP